MGGEQRGRERRRCKFQCFTTSQKYPESWLGDGNKEKFKLSNGCSSLLKFMENSLFTPSGSNESDPSALPQWPGQDMSHSFNAFHHLLPFQSSSFFSHSL